MHPCSSLRALLSFPSPGLLLPAKDDSPVQVYPHLPPPTCPGQPPVPTCHLTGNLKHSQISGAINSSQRPSKQGVSKPPLVSHFILSLRKDEGLWACEMVEWVVREGSPRRRCRGTGSTSPAFSLNATPVTYKDKAREGNNILEDKMP